MTEPTTITAAGYHLEIRPRPSGAVVYTVKGRRGPLRTRKKTCGPWVTLPLDLLADWLEDRHGNPREDTFAGLVVRIVRAHQAAKGGQT